MGFTLGLDAKLHINTIDVGVARSAWPGSGLPQDSTNNDIQEFTNVRNVTANVEVADTDITVRGGNGWRQFAPTLFEASLDFESIWDPGDAKTNSLFAEAFLGRATVQAVPLDTDNAGGQGLWADWIVSSGSRTEDLEEALMIDFSLKVGRGTLGPTWETVG